MDIVSAFKELPTKPEIILMTPPPVYAANDAVGKINADRVNTLVTPFLFDRVIKERGFMFVDAYSLFCGNMIRKDIAKCTQSDTLDDGVHPNNYGYDMLAQAVYTRLTEYIPSCAQTSNSNDSEHHGKLVMPSLHSLLDPITTIHQSNPFKDQNLMYVKIEKVGGSTVAGVVRHIAHHIGRQYTDNHEWIKEEPGVWAAHGPLKKLQKETNFDNLTKKNLIISWVRDPVERCMSEFYHFEVTRHNGKKNETINTLDTDDRKIDFMTKRCLNYQSWYLSPKPAKKGTPVANVLEPIMKTYDFIGVQERFDESMVSLAFQLNLSYCDILYLEAKNSTKDSSRGFLDELGNSVVMHKPVEAESDAVKQYIKSGFTDRNKVDFALHAAAKARLDASIASIGHERFKRALGKYQELLRLAEGKCTAKLGGEALSAAQAHRCYHLDEGCGHDCTDKVCMEEFDCKIEPIVAMM
jgi:hypothetical protein